MPEVASGAAADVVVLGAGAAGLIAALEAADAGASVLLLESEADVGGSSALAAGHVVLCGTPFVGGGHAELLEDLVAAHHGGGDIELSQAYVDESPHTFRRLESLGIRFARSVQLAHMRRPWAHEMPIANEAGGAQIVRALTQAARQRENLRLVTAHRATRLVRDEHRVRGVVVEHAGREQILHARKGVVLATGGFTRNAALIRNFGSAGTERIVPVTGQGSRGDGLLMAQALGAGTAWLTRGIAPTAPVERDSGKAVLLMYCGAVIVNRDGERFCCESDLYNDISWKGLQQPDGLMIMLYDQRVRAVFAATMWASVFSGATEYRDATLDGLLAQLAQHCGLDVARAARSLDEYNRSVGGPDPRFGRRHLVGTAGDRTAIDSGPFFATITVPGTTHFNGGLAVDQHMQVHDVMGRAIPGLYAAGEITGGFHGPGYMSATQYGAALNFGRIAGKHAASGGESVAENGDVAG